MFFKVTFSFRIYPYIRNMQDCNDFMLYVIHILPYVIYLATSVYFDLVGVAVRQNRPNGLRGSTSITLVATATKNKTTLLYCKSLNKIWSLLCIRPIYVLYVCLWCLYIMFKFPLDMFLTMLKKFPRGLTTKLPLMRTTQSLRHQPKTGVDNP